MVKLPGLDKEFNWGSERSLYKTQIKPMAAAAGAHIIRLENQLYPGTPDCWACREGKSYWIELKNHNGILSEDQVDFMKKLYDRCIRMYVVKGGKNDKDEWQIAVYFYDGKDVKMLFRFIKVMKFSNIFPLL